MSVLAIQNELYPFTPLSSKIDSLNFGTQVMKKNTAYSQNSKPMPTYANDVTFKAYTAPCKVLLGHHLTYHLVANLAVLLGHDCRGEQRHLDLRLLIIGNRLPMGLDVMPQTDASRLQCRTHKIANTDRRPETRLRQTRHVTLCLHYISYQITTRVFADAMLELYTKRTVILGLPALSKRIDT